MKSASASCFFLALLFYCFVYAHASNARPYEFSAHLEKMDYTWGERIVVFTFIKNGNQTINYIQRPSDPYLLYEITVNESSGNNAPHTDYWQTTRWCDAYEIQHPETTVCAPPFEMGKIKSGFFEGSIKDVDLPPEGIKNKNFALETLYDFSIPGKYLVDIATTKDFGGLTTQSQQLSLQISPPEEFQLSSGQSTALQPLVVSASSTLKQAAPIQLDVCFANIANGATTKIDKILNPTWGNRFY